MNMIRSAIAGILALLTASAALAQTFPTVPAQTVIGRLGTPGSSGPSQPIPFATLTPRLFASPITGTLTLTPAANSLAQGFSITQSGAGTAPVTPPFILGNHAFNSIHITQDNVDASSANGVVAGLIVQNDVSGTSSKGNHGAGVFAVNVNGAVPTDGTFTGVTGLTFLGQSLYPMGGTGTGPSTAKGSIYGFNSYGIAYGPGGSWPGATNLFNVTGGEVNVKIATGASAYYKSGLQVVSLGDDAVQGSSYDIGLSLSNITGAVGWKTGIGFSPANGQAPVSATGTLIGTIGSATVDKGIDLSSYTITTSAFKSNGFNVNGNGDTTVPRVYFSGSVSGNTELKAAASPANVITLPLQNTTLAGLAQQETWTAQQLFSDTTLTLLPASGAGAATLKYPNTANVVILTLPTSTDTLLGKATADILTNKTFDTAGAGNSFSINGVAATANTGTGSVVRATSPTLVTPALGTPSAVVLTNATGYVPTAPSTTTPTPTCGSGSGTLSSTIQYVQTFGEKWVKIAGTITMTAVGTCGTNIQLALPVTASGTYGGGLAGINVTNGKPVMGAINPAIPSTATFLATDGTGPPANGNAQTIAFSGGYFAP